MITWIKRKFHVSKISELAMITLILAIAFSLIDTVWAVYMYDFLHNDSLVGLLSTLFTVLSLASYFYLIPFIEEHDKVKMYKWSLFLIAISYILFGLTNNFWILVLLGCFLSILSVVRIDSFGIIVKQCSTVKALVTNEGLIYTFSNVGWVIGPFIAALISERYGIPIIFLLGGLFVLLAWASYSALGITVPKQKKAPKISVINSIKLYLKNKDLVKIYIISGSSSVWWSFIFIYVPLYIIESGLSVKWIAYFILAVIVPILLFEYLFCKLANKIGYKWIFFIGNLFTASVLVVCFFIGNIYLLMGVLVLGSIGLAMTEATTEAYFFLVAPKKGVDGTYSIYNTALEVFSIIGKLFVAGVLVILAFKYSFLILAAVFAWFAFISLRVKEVPRV